jgi:hypothetical protein
MSDGRRSARMGTTSLLSPCGVAPSSCYRDIRGENTTAMAMASGRGSRPPWQPLP